MPKRIYNRKREEQTLDSLVECSFCKIEKTADLFYWGWGRKKAYRMVKQPCKECTKERSRAYWKKVALRPDYKDKKKNRTLRDRYRMSLEEYNQMIEFQEGKCAICRELPGSKGLNVDHCHKTRKVRALLCNRCNVFVGAIESKYYEKIKDYIAEHSMEVEHA